MATLTQTTRTAAYLSSEASGYRSRETGTLDDTVSGTLAAGTVIAKLTSGGKIVQYDASGSDGSQTIVGILFEGGVAGDDRTYTARDAEIVADELNWPSGLNAAGIVTGTSALAALGIVAR